LIVICVFAQNKTVEVLLKIYEALMVFKPIMDVENAEAVLKQFEKTCIDALGGKILEVDRIGRKKLVVEMKRFKDGFISTYIFNMPPNKMSEFRRLCSINEDILRVSLIRIDDLELIKREAASRDERRQGRFQRRDDREDTRQQG
jgi:small subunit ribosomal protein S6